MIFKSPKKKAKSMAKKKNTKTTRRRVSKKKAALDAGSLVGGLALVLGAKFATNKIPKVSPNVKNGILVAGGLAAILMGKKKMVQTGGAMLVGAGAVSIAATNFPEHLGDDGDMLNYYNPEVMEDLEEIRSELMGAGVDPELLGQYEDSVLAAYDSGVDPTEVEVMGAEVMGAGVDPVSDLAQHNQMLGAGVDPMMM